MTQVFVMAPHIVRSYFAPHCPPIWLILVDFENQDISFKKKVLEGNFFKFNFNKIIAADLAHLSRHLVARPKVHGIPKKMQII